jgi:hypothetical protein
MTFHVLFAALVDGRLKHDQLVYGLEISLVLPLYALYVKHKISAPWHQLPPALATQRTEKAGRAQCP